MSQLEDLLQLCTVKLSLSNRVGWGTGFFVAPGWILTCAHVIQEAQGQPIQVRWQNQENWAEAVVERSLPDPYDLALLCVTLPTDANPPCALLDENICSRDPLYLFGYPDEDFPNGCPVTFNCEGLTGDTLPLIKFALGQVRPGMSGAPLLNQQTGKVCGMVKFTRARSFDLGGGAIPVHVILKQFPELRDLQQQFHQSDRRWRDQVVEPSEINFQAYLRAIATTYEKWWQLYTLTDAEGKRRQKELSPIFDFGLMVQTVPKKNREQQEEEKVERFSVLEGIRKFADQHVLLVGRPGSGKSTSLARLLLEEATNPQSKIPVLVELRYWQGSITELILNAFTRHGFPLSAEQLETVLARSLILFDGINELPSEEARLQLSTFRHNHPKLPMIFTTRDLNLGGDLGIGQKLEMHPLTEAQMRAFIRSYVPEQADQMLHQLKDRLREFGQTPLLLWMLCEVFQQVPDSKLPSNLAEVFQVFTDVYENSSVRKHEVAALKGDVRPLSDRRLWKKALKGLAATMMQGETPVDFRVVIDRDTAERQLSKIFPTERFPVRDILDDLLKYHLLQNQRTAQIEFRHQLIQEYYAAEALLEQLPTLSDAVLKCECLNYLKWMEPLALMLALVESEAQAVRVVKLALEVDWLLGARLAGEVKPQFQEKTVGMVNQLHDAKQWKLGLMQFTQKLEPPLWLKAQLLGMTRSENFIPILLKLMKHSNSDVRSSAAWALVLIGSESALPGLLKLADHSNPDVCWGVAAVLGDIGVEMSIPGLCKLAKHSDFLTRRKVVEELEKIGIEQCVPGLLKLLEDPDSEVRSRAAAALGKIKSEMCIPGLLKLLEDPNSGVRKSAVEALSDIKSETCIPGLLKLLEGTDFLYARWSAVEVLSSISSETTIPDLLKLLEDADLYVAGKALTTLASIGETAIPDLLKLLESPVSEVRSSAACALGLIGSETAIPGLLKLLEESDPYMRGRAAYELGQIGSETPVPRLLQLLKDADSEVGVAAAKALGCIGSETAISGLLKLLKDSDLDLYVYWKSVCASGIIGSETAISSLLQLLEDSDSEVRAIAAEALGSIRSETALLSLPNLVKYSGDVTLPQTRALSTIESEIVMSNLLQLLKHPDSEVRATVAKALGRMSSESAISGLLQLAEDSNSYVRLTVAEALGNIESEMTISGLLKLLKDSDSSVSWTAANILSEIGSERIIPDLLQILKDSDLSVSVRTVKILSKIESETTIPGLLKLLKDSNSQVRWRAVGILGEIGSERIIPDLLQLLKDSNSQVRQNVAEALENIGSEKSIPSLLKLLKDSDSTVRWRAIEALGKIGSASAIDDLLKLLKDSNLYTYAVKALIAIAEKHIDTVPQYLPDLLTLLPTKFGQESLNVIVAIQENCKYYNYNLWQDAIQTKKLERKNGQQRDECEQVNPLFPKTIEVEIFE